MNPPTPSDPPSPPQTPGTPSQAAGTPAAKTKADQMADLRAARDAAVAETETLKQRLATLEPLAPYAEVLPTLTPQLAALFGETTPPVTALQKLPEHLTALRSERDALDLRVREFDVTASQWYQTTYAAPIQEATATVRESLQTISWDKATNAPTVANAPFVEEATAFLASIRPEHISAPAIKAALEPLQQKHGSPPLDPHAVTTLVSSLRQRATLAAQAEEARRQAPASAQAHELHRAAQARASREEALKQVTTLMPELPLWATLPQDVAAAARNAALAAVAAQVETPSLRASAETTAKAALLDQLLATPGFDVAKHLRSAPATSNPTPATTVPATTPVQPAGFGAFPWERGGTRYV